ncbi:MAG: DUF4070 domain-containing protein [Parcubacteria group bacterium]|nr:DUF4070 domain-containing protein [Parcubacteria group bacterium]
MKALLLYPEFPDTFWSFKHVLRFIRRKASLPPLGLVTVAAMLPKDWELRLVDLNVRELVIDDILWADCALISAMVVQRASAKELIARCNEHRVPVIAGGPLFTEESEYFPEVDHLVLGEAENIFPEFLADFLAGKARHLYRSPGYSDIRQAPVPRWDLVNIRDYASMSLQSSRGCPYDCDFCDITVLFGRVPRVKTPEQIAAELDALREAGWRKPVFFVDDNFIGNKPYLKKTLLPAIIAWQERHGFPFTFYTEATITLAHDEELTRLMTDAGFTVVFIGIETPDEAGLVGCNKRQNTRGDLVDDVKRLQRAGIQVQAGFIVGFDTDTESIFERQIAFIQQSGIATAMVSVLQALPGTKLHKRLESEGRIRGMVTGDNVDATTNIVPVMPLATLMEGYRSIMWHIYAPKHYYRRVRTFLREYRPARIPRVRLDWQDFMALWRSMLHLGILGEERFHYWGLIAWTMFRKPWLISVAIKSAVYGYHFRKMTAAKII